MRNKINKKTSNNETSNNSNRVLKCLLSSGMQKYFSPVIIDRMVMIGKMLEENMTIYRFDVIQDGSWEGYPTGVFTISEIAGEDNEITAFVSDLTSIRFIGATRCVDVYSGDEIVNAMASTGQDGMGLRFFRPSVEDYGDEFEGITPTYILPVSTNCGMEMVDVLRRLVTELLAENRRFLRETREYEADVDLDSFDKKCSAKKVNDSYEEELPMPYYPGCEDDRKGILREIRRSMQETEEKIKKLEALVEEEEFPFV